MIIHLVIGTVLLDNDCINRFLNNPGTLKSEVCNPKKSRTQRIPKGKEKFIVALSEQAIKYKQKQY